MTKITLRGYILEIEKIIEQGKTEEAIAHCRQILNSYPKHVDTYRLMGKAYLESRRYGDASDIFQRVLSAIPDDFVSHVGMSIIREDEGNLDASIWHMERAFEVQPYNAAIQNELRRLYGRRDGMEPPKVRLTQGALARMYAKGNLFQQAIAELRSAISDDPRRSDLQIILARMYAENGQNAEAVETCIDILQQLPHCLDANRILGEILPGTGRIDEVAKYKKRIEALDPYEAHISPNAPTASEVPDQAVNIERLEWEPGMITTEVTAQPDWATSLGVTLDEETDEEQLPGWLTSSREELTEEELSQIYDGEPTGAEPFISDSGELEVAKEETSEEYVPDLETVEFEEEELPDWMESELQPTGEVRGSDDTPIDWDREKEQELDIDQTEIPEWLQDVVPPRDDTAGEQPEEMVFRDEGIESEELPEWLQGLEEVSSEEEIPEWLAEHDEEHEVEESEKPISRQPEIELIEGETQPKEPSELSDEMEQETISEELQADTTIPDESPDWLQDLEASTTIGTEEEIEELLDLESADMPQWLRDIAQETPAAMEAGVPSEEDAEDIDIEKAEVPDWLQDISEDSLVTEEVQESTPTDEGEGLPFSLDDEDAALAWLESLAAKQGVHEDELITTLEERREISSEEKSETKTTSEEEIMAPEEAPFVPTLEQELTDEPEPELPEWLSDFMEEAPKDTEVEEFESIEEITPEMPGEAEIPEWLAELDEDIPEISEAEPEVLDFEERISAEITPESEVPIEPVVDLDKEPPVAEVETDISTKEPAPTIESELPDWLIDLADETSETPEEIEAQAPEIVEFEEELVEEGAEEPDYKIPDEEVVTEEITEWMVGTEKEPDEELSEVEPSAEEIEAEITEQVFHPITERDELEEIEAGEFEITREYDFEPEAVDVEKKPVEIPDELEAVKVEPDIEEAPDWIREEIEEPEIAREEVQTADEIPPSPDLVDINTASEELLETLQGIGPHLAQSIVSHRETHGPFNKLEDLMNVAGIGPTHLEGFQELVTVEVIEGISPEGPIEDEFQTIHTRGVENLSQGNVDDALEDYDRLIKSDYKLEQVIQELSEATYQHPLDIALLQSLGDAYMRSDQLQEALEVYNKAEELLR